MAILTGQRCLGRIRSARQQIHACRRGMEHVNLQTDHISAQILTEEWLYLITPEANLPPTLADLPRYFNNSRNLIALNACVFRNAEFKSCPIYGGRSNYSFPMETDSGSGSMIPDRVSMPDLVSEEDIMLSIFEELQSELREQEAKLIQMYESELCEEREAIDRAVADEQTHQHSVFCPICCKSWLFENHGVIFCRCGFRVDTGVDGITLASLKIRLEGLTESHCANCVATPEFKLDVQPHLTALLMKCEVCGFFEFVL